MSAKPVVLLTTGTRGDIWPYLALGQGLQAAGQPVRVATHAEFQPWVAAAGLPFARLDGNLSEWMTRAGGQSALTYDGSVWRNAQATGRYWRAARPVLTRLLASAREAARGAALVIAGLASTWGPHIAEAEGVRCAWALLQPVTATRAFPSALLPFRFSLGGRYAWLTHQAVALATWLPWRGVINAWRRSVGLRPAGLTSPLAVLQRAQTGVVVGVSPHLLPPPADWPAGHTVTGYWFYDAPAAGRPPPALERFLESGPAVSLSFGSPGVRAARPMLAKVLDALKLAGLRAVVAVPPELADEAGPEHHVFPVADVPHTWLFPRVAAAAHHGGAGTTAASLRAGTPTVIMPLAIDQFFWGERVAALGVGPPPVPQRALTAPALARALRQAVDDPAGRARAQRLGAAIRAEAGVARAVAAIRAWV
ncbi:MAG: glycosyltransferase family 1 protein [Anaerolineales bacterium]|nr:glycosyltransferase family 1 protein [Anaerolineales bacterium]